MAILEEVTRRALRPPLAPCKEPGHKKPLTTKSGEGVLENSEPLSRERHARETVGQVAAATATRAPRRRQKKDRIPPAIRRSVIEFAKRLRAEFGATFETHRMMKRDLAKLLASQLPPLPRPPGRPGYPLVSRAIQLRARLRRSQPDKTPKEIWIQIYGELIPRHGDLPLLERLAAENQLHDQVRWRLNARRRRLRAAGGKTAR